MNSNNINKQIKELLNQGKSGSQIAKQLHIRKQIALEKVREIKKIPLENKHITNPYGQKGKPDKLDKTAKSIIENNIKNGLPKRYTLDSAIKTNNGKIRKNQSYKSANEYYNELMKNPDLKKQHKDSYLALRKLYGKKYKQSLDAKHFKFTNKHYYSNPLSQFTEGSPKLMGYDYDAEVI